MRAFSVAVIAVVLLMCAPARGKEKYEEVTEMEFMANKSRLIDETIALMTYMGDLMDISERDVPVPGSQTTIHAISAMANRKMVKFVIPETKENEKTIELFYTLSPGSSARPGTQITIYGKVIKGADGEIFILVQREGAVAIEEGWPEEQTPCPTCGRLGFSGGKKPPQKGDKGKRTRK